MKYDVEESNDIHGIVGIRKKDDNDDKIITLDDLQNLQNPFLEMK